MAKIKVDLCFLSRFCVLLCFVVLVVAGTETDTDSRSSDANPSQTPDPDSDSELSLVMQRFAQVIEKRNREQGKVVEEMRQQIESLQSAQETCKAEVKSLSQKVDQLESKISSDRGVWLMTPPLRGPPGTKGEKGQDGQPGKEGLPGSPGQPGAIGEKGAVGPPGKNGENGQDGKTGVKGADGQPGQEGRPGKNGVDGATGNQGLPGSPGQPGAIGEKGAVGPSGKEGEKGISGLTDPQSIKNCDDAMENLPFAPQRLSIYPHQNNKRVEVLCDFETDGGGWTIIQKRSSGPKEEFQKTWTEYSNGFGPLDKNFWIGLENIHALTKNGDQKLRIALEDHEGNKKYAKYSSFSVSDAADSYRLTISGFSGTAGDSMTNSNYVDLNNGMRFSTKDRDNDNHPSYDCAANCGGGGWWFRSCGFSSLNGLYFENGETVSNAKGIWWYFWKGTTTHSLAKTEMKIRTRKT